MVTPLTSLACVIILTPYFCSGIKVQVLDAITYGAYMDPHESVFALRPQPSKQVLEAQADVILFTIHVPGGPGKVSSSSPSPFIPPLLHFFSNSLFSQHAHFGAGIVINLFAQNKKPSFGLADSASPMLMNEDRLSLNVEEYFSKCLPEGIFSILYSPPPLLLLVFSAVRLFPASRHLSSPSRFCSIALLFYSPLLVFSVVPILTSSCLLPPHPSPLPEGNLLQRVPSDNGIEWSLLPIPMQGNAWSCGVCVANIIVKIACIFKSMRVTRFWEMEDPMQVLMDPQLWADNNRESMLLRSGLRKVVRSQLPKAIVREDDDDDDDDDDDQGKCFVASLPLFFQSFSFSNYCPYVQMTTATMVPVMSRSRRSHSSNARKEMTSRSRRSHSNAITRMIRWRLTMPVSPCCRKR